MLFSSSEQHSEQWQWTAQWAMTVNSAVSNDSEQHSEQWQWTAQWAMTVNSAVSNDSEQHSEQWQWTAQWAMTVNSAVSNDTRNFSIFRTLLTVYLCKVIFKSYSYGGYVGIYIAIIIVG